MKYYVYELYNTINNNIFYIGYSNYERKSNKTRLEDHIKWALVEDYKPTLKNNIIRKIYNNGLEIKQKIVFETNIEKEALDLEIALIKQYGRRDLNLGPLANNTDGGTGGNTIAGFSKQELIMHGKKISDGHNNKSRIEKQIAAVHYSVAQQKNGIIYQKNAALVILEK